MKFVLNEYHRNVPSEILLADVKRVASHLGRPAVTKKEQDTYGKYNSSTLGSRFGGWNKALEAAGLGLTRRLDITDEELLSDVVKVSRKLGRDTVTLLEQDEHGQFNSSTLIHRFGKWSSILPQVGLDYTRSPRNVSNEELLENLEEVWAKLARQPVHGEMSRPLSRYSAGTYARAFGSWRKALEAFVASVEAETNETDKESDQTGFALSQSSCTPPQSVLVEQLRAGRDKRSIGWRLRFIVMRADNFRCRLCGQTQGDDPSSRLEVDHIKAWSKGGRTVFANLQTLCRKCNIGKSDLEFDTALANEVQNVEV